MCENTHHNRCLLDNSTLEVALFDVLEDGVYNSIVRGVVIRHNNRLISDYKLPHWLLIDDSGKLVTPLIGYKGKVVSINDQLPNKIHMAVDVMQVLSTTVAERIRQIEKESGKCSITVKDGPLIGLTIVFRVH